ncbi:hypothetical protein HRR83_002416 [Exophiala dermatitidis]|uniref:VOC domain-containing protein n=2 Tax=Exophiala dermatitidis TaxID=5970 RepID=H6C128_EXODN|nr:uncharacterized protein HMPREF1120_04580 [Exophiala dermatitidis NIH/UT8656]KAJ4520422.1 hypothetical protein HRR75_002287 [Exophiala dermatitidis]EHY56499.1 hypothetical protein HMPREF1120_04580 [Exophiala dermatitidis NIH/UT8656]KAJ4524297.1 hypothetical protein HRR74_002494 [Exophiala dermatitidis]KAJ4555651.1 hypothetical protein HRR77_001580 [Exophiala dermatitidis]KAJ4556208.1 hypothetical protein HRR78_001867 [Exophiala dermatitidis]
MITGLAHINLTVPEGTLDLANEFYGETLGLTPRPVPSLQKGQLAWFDIIPEGGHTNGEGGADHGASPYQQVHIAFGPAKEFLPENKSSRHPCFRLASPEALLQLRQRIWDHFVRGGAAAPREADEPGSENSGAKGVEYPQRFFARDYAGNRLEFSL